MNPLQLYESKLSALTIFIIILNLFLCLKIEFWLIRIEIHFRISPHINQNYQVYHSSVLYSTILLCLTIKFWLLRIESHFNLINQNYQPYESSLLYSTRFLSLMIEFRLIRNKIHILCTNTLNKIFVQSCVLYGITTYNNFDIN